MKTLYLECNMGAAGDMLMGALYEVCDQKEYFLYKINQVFAPFGITVTAESTVKSGVRGTHMKVLIHGEEEHSHDVHHEQAHSAGDAHDVHTQECTEEMHMQEQESGHEHEHSHAHEHVHTDYASVLAKIQSLDLPKEVIEDASAIYKLLGEAEAAVHGTTLEQIHFHEVGTLDALADVVGCAYLLRLTAPEQILASPIHLGNGFVRCAHGVLPVPAPATAELLKDVPCYTGAITGELCTPTGAAILKYYVEHFLAMPALSPSAIGYGMGQKDFEIMNCVRAFLGDTPMCTMDNNTTNDNATNGSAIYGSAIYGAETTSSCDDMILSISANLDDMTGEAIGLATEIFMAAGALDVYTIPIQMKKSRPGILLTCLCELCDREKFTGLFFLHTSTRGVRYQTFERAKLESTFETRATTYGKIRIKKSSGYGIEKEKPEFEDLKSVVLKNHCAMSLDDITKLLH